MLTAYIADDEPLARTKLKLFLQKTGRVGDICEYDNGIALLAAIDRATPPPDLLVVDIQMPGMTGLDVLERLHTMPQVIVTSAFERYALPSFQFHVCDYLLKPYTYERLLEAVGRAAANIRLQELDRRINAATLAIRIDGRTESLPLADVVYFEAQRDYVRIVTVDGHSRRYLESISTLQQQLPDSFTRIHRSFIVNQSHVVAIGRSITVSTGEELPIGRSFRDKTALIEQNIGALP